VVNPGHGFAVTSSVIQLVEEDPKPLLKLPDCLGDTIVQAIRVTVCFAVTHPTVTVHLPSVHEVGNLPSVARANHVRKDFAERFDSEAGEIFDLSG
jgi:hypothetical protein